VAEVLRYALSEGGRASPRRIIALRGLGDESKAIRSRGEIEGEVRGGDRQTQLGVVYDAWLTSGHV
jgi:hypothetical protein